MSDKRETKKAATARERREDEAEQEAQDTLDAAASPAEPPAPAAPEESFTSEELKDPRVAESIGHVMSSGFSESEAAAIVKKFGTSMVLAHKECDAPAHEAWGTPKARD